MLEKKKILHRLYIVWTIAWHLGIIVGFMFWTYPGMFNALVDSGKDTLSAWYLSGIVSLFGGICTMAWSTSFLGWLFHGKSTHFLTGEK